MMTGLGCVLWVERLSDGGAWTLELALDSVEVSGRLDWDWAGGWRPELNGQASSDHLFIVICARPPPTAPPAACLLNSANRTFVIMA